jgi:hypothetical protein
VFHDTLQHPVGVPASNWITRPSDLTTRPPEQVEPTPQPLLTGAQL